MISCIIVDDEQHAIDILVEYIKKTPFLHLIYSTSNPLEALSFIQNKPVDLVFLDIHMPDLTGIQFLKVIGNRCKCILTTAYTEYALEGYEYAVVDYLLKPFSFDRFLSASQKVLNTLPLPAQPLPSTDSQNDYVLVKAGVKGKMIKISLDDILFIEGLKNYVSIVTVQEKVIAYLNIKDLEKELPQSNFLRIHKSYIVSLNKIQAIDGNQVILPGTRDKRTTVPIGGTYKNSFFSHLREKILGEKRKDR